MELVEIFGLDVILVGMVAIALVGFIRIILKPLFNRLGRKTSKTVYEALSVAFAFMLTAIWLVVTKQVVVPFEDNVMDIYLSRTALVYASIKVMYPLYENLHFREIVRGLGKVILKIFKRDKKLSKTTEVIEEILEPEIKEEDKKIII